jgi:ATP-binding cassette subfamily C protein CydD
MTPTGTTADAAPTRVRPVDPRLLRYAAASRPFFVLIAVIAAGQTAAVIGVAWFLTRAIVGAIEGMPAGELGATLAALGGVVGARAVLAWAREAVGARAAAGAQLQLRDALLDAVDRLGPEWLAHENTARLALTAGRGLEALEGYFGRYLPQLVLTVIATPLLVGVMWLQDPLSAVTVALTLPLIPTFMVLIGLATRAVQKRQWDTLAHLAARFADTVRGLGTLKLYQRQERAVAAIAETTDTYRRETMTVLRVSFLSGFALEFLASISVAIVAVSIGFRLLDGGLSLAVGLFVLLLAPEAYLPLRQVGVQFHAAAEGVAATDGVFSILDAARHAPARHLSAPASAPATTVSAGPPVDDLVIAGLRVRRGERMLPPVDLVARPGSVTLLAGPSGAGKSSVLAALRGAAAFDGTATFRGQDVRSLAPSEWLAWAGQEPVLLAGSVIDNVALGDSDADADLVARALTSACAEGIAPNRDLGVRGAGLSGGQAQRVAVARAVYRHLRGRAPVIALDEPSAALDADTEDRLWRSLRRLADDGATVLLVSHRPSATVIADQVIEVGTREVADVTA